MTERVCPILHAWLFRSSVLIFAALLFSSQLALAQFTQQGPKLVGAGVVGYAFQGFSVASSADGNTAISGGYYDNSNIGAAWVFTRSGGVWAQQGSKLVGTGAVGPYGAQQGTSVSLSDNQGNTTRIATLTVNPKEYTITVRGSPSADGTVSGGGTFTEGGSNTVTATPNSGFHFVQWTEAGHAVSTSATYTFTMPSKAVTLVADFQKN
jgi:hypothetical protein